jgi:PIN domain nuclease of toxin-antitoxin system
MEIVNGDHARLAGVWKVSHRKPFDRMPAAQAHLEKLVLATVDNALLQFPVEK